MNHDNNDNNDIVNMAGTLADVVLEVVRDAEAGNRRLQVLAAELRDVLRHRERVAAYRRAALARLLERVAAGGAELQATNTPAGAPPGPPPEDPCVHGYERDRCPSGYVGLCAPASARPAVARLRLAFAAGYESTRRASAIRRAPSSKEAETYPWMGAPLTNTRFEWGPVDVTGAEPIAVAPAFDLGAKAGRWAEELLARVSPEELSARVASEPFLQERQPPTLIIDHAAHPHMRLRVEARGALGFAPLQGPSTAPPSAAVVALAPDETAALRKLYESHARPPEERIPDEQIDADARAPRRIESPYLRGLRNGLHLAATTAARFSREAAEAIEQLAAAEVAERPLVGLVPGERADG